MGLKVCFKCGGVYPIEDFYKHPQMADGHLNKCKACTKTDTRTNRRKKADKYNAYDKERGNRLTKEDINKYRRNNPEKQKAHAIVSRALLKGTLVKQPCEVCGDSCLVEAHHECYDKPLEITWLCPHHHRWIHG